MATKMKITDAEGTEVTPMPIDKTALELGTKVQTRLSGHPVEGGIMSFAPAIDYCLKAHLFGDLFGRDSRTDLVAAPAHSVGAGAFHH